MKQYLNKKHQKLAWYIAPWALVVTLITGVVVVSLLSDGQANDQSSGSNSAVGQQEVNTDQTYDDMIEALEQDESYKNPLTNLSYAELFRNIDNYKGQFAHYTGEVIQVLGEPGDWNLRVNITKDESYGDYVSYDDTVYIFSYSKDRVIEDDIIEFTARINGLMTYEATLGQEITIPSLTIYKHELVGRNE